MSSPNWLDRTVAAFAVLSAGTTIAGTPRNWPAGAYGTDLLSQKTVVLGASNNPKSLILAGTIVEGFDPVTGQFGSLRGRVEYRLLRPDGFLRIKQWQIDRAVSEFRVGFYRGTVVTPNSSGPAQAAEYAGPLRNYRLWFARLALGVAGWTDTVVPVTLAKNAVRSGTARISGPDGFEAAVDLDASGSPLRIRYEGEMNFPGPPLSAEERRKGTVRPVRPEPTEIVLLFEDRRAVQGWLIPHRIKTVARAVVFEDIHLDKVVIDPPLAAGDFIRR